MPPNYLTPHFSLAELTASQAATRAGLRNVPDRQTLWELKRLAETLEQVRSLLDAPVLVSSGYRSPEVNRLVGGAANSAHVRGCAADFSAPRFGTPLEICRKLLAHGLVIDQLIYEGTWVHLGIAAGGAVPRQQVLTAVFAAGRPTTVCVRPSHLDGRRSRQEGPQEAADQRCGSNSSMRLAGCVGSRSSTSLRYA